MAWSGANLDELSEQTVGSGYGMITV